MRCPCDFRTSGKDRAHGCKDYNLQKGARTMRSHSRLTRGAVAAALMAAVTMGCAAQRPPGPDPWVTAGQQATAAASRADAAAVRAEAAATRAEAAAARAGKTAWRGLSAVPPAPLLSQIVR